MSNDLLTISEVATLLGLKPDTVAAYHSKAQRNRREEREREVDMPAPDQIVGRIPTWRPATIAAWMTKRGTAS